MNIYNIYVVNHSTETQTFWSFLDKPIGITGSEVYANSSAFITVEPNSQSENKFGIPLQFQVGSGASNKAVGLQTRISSTNNQDTDLNKTWDVEYFDPADHRGPNMKETGPTGNAKTIIMNTNSYDKSQEGPNGWYGNMSFGIESENGFIGVSWSPEPNKQYTITPQVTFYIAVGSYQSNKLADINAISRTSASVSTSDFDNTLSATVYYNSDGSWTVVPGKPDTSLFLASGGSIQQLVQAHAHLAEAHNQLVRLAAASPSASAAARPALGSDEVERTSQGITTHVGKGVKGPDDVELGNPWLTGTITVGRAVGLGFLYILSTGIKLNITNRHADGLRFDFSYDGTESRRTVTEAFEKGKEIFFEKD